jgi:hypothetical protein
MSRTEGYMACRPHPDIAAELARAARARAWAFIFRCFEENNNAAGITSTNGTILRNTEGVSDVERRPD